MRTKNRLIAFLLLFVFGFLIFKNLLPEAAQTLNENCDEFAHIHWIKVPQDTTKEDSQEDSHKSAHGQERDCHSGKSIFSYSLLPVLIFSAPQWTYQIVFELVLNQPLHFKSPYLEPLRKPPKFA